MTLTQEETILVRVALNDIISELTEEGAAKSYKNDISKQYYQSLYTKLACDKAGVNYIFLDMFEKMHLHGVAHTKIQDQIKKLKAKKK